MVGYAFEVGASIVIPLVDLAKEAQQVASLATYGAQNRGIHSTQPFDLVPCVSEVPVDRTRSVDKDLH